MRFRFAIRLPVAPRLAALLVIALALAFPAFAQDAAPAPAAPSVGSVLGQLFGSFLTPTGIASAVVAILGIVGGLLHLSERRKRQIAIVTQHAFHGVYDFAATTDTDVDDKIAAGLKIADDWMKANGWRPLAPGEQDVVKLGFNALNGATKAAAAVQVSALKFTEPAATTPSSPPTP